MSSSSESREPGDSFVIFAAITAKLSSVSQNAQRAFFHSAIAAMRLDSDAA